MSALHQLRMAARRLGLDVERWPRDAAAYHSFRALTSLGPKTLIDVGANVGQFGRQSRQFGFRGLIVSLEPGKEAFEQLVQASHADALWVALQLAAGAESGESELHVASNNGQSSSLLSMNARHAAAAPEAVYTGASELVRTARLDELASDQVPQWVRPVLKIDVQGYERLVLEGAGDWLDQVLALQIELSLQPLYDGDWVWSEALDWLEAKGFQLACLEPGLFDSTTSRLLQFDGVFVNGRYMGSH